jgi:hypothetical protein
LIGDNEVFVKISEITMENERRKEIKTDNTKKM